MNNLVILRIVFILGIFQGLMALVILLSCRCMTGFPFGAKLMKNTSFRKFFKYHCYFWWPFWVSVAAHIALAAKLVGFPF